MPLRLYNTLTRRLEDFQPLKPTAVTMYVCGPTVYDVPHLGHARSAYVFDVLRRYLTYKQFKVTFVRNVTDVDDKIIQKAREELTRPGGHEDRAGGTADRGQQTGDSLKQKCREVAERSLKSYHDALAQLGIQPPDEEPKATEHVLPDAKHIDASMTGFIAQLLVKGAAYEAGGDVYFAVRKFSGYGKLSNRSIDELQSGARVDPEEQKRDPLDFALWKAAKPDEPSWGSPWGPGRPGWHIECSVMSTRYLGDAFDIHGGGVDLVFPHHENEIAQAQALGKSFAKYWIHNGLLTVKGEKMSKSLGNFIVVNDALKACDGDADMLKLLFLQAHYRSPIDYNQDTIIAAREALDRIGVFILEAARVRRQEYAIQGSFPEKPHINELAQRFLAAMDDDLNTPLALSEIFKIISFAQGYLSNRRMLIDCEHVVHYCADTVKQFLRQTFNLKLPIKLVLQEGLHVQDVLEVKVTSKAEEERITQLCNEREQARQRKDFAKADEIRQLLLKEGIEIQDSPDGPRFRRRRK